MKQSIDTPVVKRLVLLGGGHSHVAVLKYLAMNPLPGLSITLVTRDIHTPYSGSLPGLISGFYNLQDMQIDLRPLALFAGARIIHEEINKVDLENKQLLCATRPAINFDILSINIGSKPDASIIPGSKEFATPIKPIDLFIPRWDSMLEQAKQAIHDDEGDFSIAIIGGGPASVELALATQYRISKELNFKKGHKPPISIKLITDRNELLSDHNKKVRTSIQQITNERGIKIFTQHSATRIDRESILFSDKESISAQCIFYATGASAPPWLAECGLSVTETGFVHVNTFLQSRSHPFVFAAGDIADVEGHSRPKSGVYAVRQGLPLAKNLVRFARSKALKKHIPQKSALALISTGDRHAIASRNELCFQGRWVWQIKDRIDRAFLDKYNKLPEMKVELTIDENLVDKDSREELRKHSMRCSGCGAKVGNSILQKVLQQIETDTHDDILTNSQSVEDASIIKLDSNRSLIQTVDYFRAFINDPWTFAKIATNHCLSDIYAMGAMPHSALAIVSVPFAAKKIVQEQLLEVMTGCTEVLNEHNTSLIGGHSSEAKELALGLSINGFSTGKLLSKATAQQGDVLILCKPLGTGTLFAADMRLKAKGRWIESALEQMLVSNKTAAQCLIDHQATACTDITGFGLIGHLTEMIEPEKIQVEIDINSLPIMEGALDSFHMGIYSSLQEDNRLTGHALRNTKPFEQKELYNILFDPQTSGGLLGSVPQDRALACLQDLHKQGYEYAAIIGRVTATNADEESIYLV